MVEPRPEVALALVLPPGDIGPALAAASEDQWFERKSIRTSAERIAQCEVGMANAEGGVIVVGLSEGQVEGSDDFPDRANAIRQAHMDFTQPPVRVHAETKACERANGALDHLLLLWVEPSEVVHVTNRDECYLRIGDETRRLTFHQRQELHYDKGQSHFDGNVVARVTVDQLRPDLIQQHAEKVAIVDPARLLQARGLLKRTGEVTAAAYLLFGENPQDEFPEAYVRVLRYRGVERGTGARQQLISDISCTGPIPDQLEHAANAIAEFAPNRTALGRDQKFRREGLIPTAAWMEALVNAVVHRSYSLGGDHIRVEIFDDRIEVESPGRFPGIVQLGDPRNLNRFARNPRIARAAADLQYGQELGEGIRRMFDEMRIAGLAEPAYYQSAASVRVTLSATLVNPDIERRLPPGSREVMELIREAGALSTGDVADAMGLSRPAVLVRLHALEKAGYIEWVGKSKQDPRAYWRLASDWPSKKQRRR